MTDHLERAIEATFYRAVRMAGGSAHKLAPTDVGMPDRMVLLHGRVYLVELKKLGGKLRPAQLEWHRRAAGKGVHVVVLTGRDQALSWVRDTAAQPPSTATTDPR